MILLLIFKRLASQAESRSNFIDFERGMKALENAHVTTLQTHVSFFEFGNLDTITPNGHPIMKTPVSTPSDIADPNAHAENRNSLIVSHTAACRS